MKSYILRFSCFYKQENYIYSLYERDADRKIKYDVSGKPIYSYINPVIPDLNTLVLSELDGCVAKVARITTSPYAQVKFWMELLLRLSLV